MGRTVERGAGGMEYEMLGPGIGPATSTAEDRVAGAAPASGAVPIVGDAPIVREASIVGEAPIGGTVAIAAVCTFRTDAFTSGSGKRAASSSSTSSLPNPEAAESSSWWFSGVSRRASSRAVVGLRVRASSMSTMTGNRLAVRVVLFLNETASSERRRTARQYLNSDENPAAS